jgi:hypothetical protein
MDSNTIKTMNGLPCIQSRSKGYETIQTHLKLLKNNKSLFENSQKMC